VKIGSIVIHRTNSTECSNSGNRPFTEVDRLIDLGANRDPWRYPPDADFMVLEDPGGNLFWVVQKS